MCAPQVKRAPSSITTHECRKDALKATTSAPADATSGTAVSLAKFRSFVRRPSWPLRLSPVAKNTGSAERILILHTGPRYPVREREGAGSVKVIDTLFFFYDSHKMISVLEIIF